jgi:hypothetical protein
MRLIIAGSRTVHPTIADIDAAFDPSGLLFARVDVEEIISGCAPGADKAGERWAEHYKIPIKRMPANWDRDGRTAGKLRNRDMAIYGDMAIVFWDGMSSGSTDMVARMVARDKPVRVIPMKAGKR